MPSRKPAEPLDTFERDVPITREDAEAQWLIRERDWLSPAEYLAWCSYLTQNAPSSRDDVASPSHIAFDL